MTREEKSKAIDALKISAPIMAVTQEKFKDYIQTLNQIMDWIEQEPRWIPVSERLPDIDEEVLVDDGMDRYIAWYVNDGIDEGWHSFDESYSLDVPILAWMPLPKPYKAESKESD